MNYQEHLEHLNRNARDKRIAGSLAGLGKSRLELLEQLYSSQIKIKWYRPSKHVCRGILCECAKKTCSSRATRDFPYWARVSEFRYRVRIRIVSVHRVVQPLYTSLHIHG